MRKLQQFGDFLFQETCFVEWLYILEDFVFWGILYSLTLCFKRSTWIFCFWRIYGIFILFENWRLLSRRHSILGDFLQLCLSRNFAFCFQFWLFSLWRFSFLRLSIFGDFLWLGTFSILKFRFLTVGRLSVIEYFKFLEICCVS